MKIFIFLAAFLASILVAAGMIAFSYLFGPRKRSDIKSENFECGMTQAQPPRKAVKTNFYIIAVLFLVFDIEILYLYPWSSYIKELSPFGFISGFIFVSALLIALFYAIGRGALKWD